MSAKNEERRTKKNFSTPFIYIIFFSHRGPLSNFLVHKTKKKKSTEIHSMFILVRLHRFICTKHSVSQRKKKLKTTTKREKMREKMGNECGKKRYMTNEQKEKLWVSKRALVAIYGA